MSFDVEDKRMKTNFPEVEEKRRRIWAAGDTRFRSVNINYFFFTFYKITRSDAQRHSSKKKTRKK